MLNRRGAPVYLGPPTRAWPARCRLRPV